MKTLKSYHKEHIEKMKKMKRISLGVFCILLILFAFIFIKMYNAIINPNTSTKEDYSLYIYSNDDFETIKNTLYSDSIIINKKTFEWLAKKLDYPKYIIVSTKGLTYIKMPAIANPATPTQKNILLKIKPQILLGCSFLVMVF